jgi:hypothetical protein
MTKRIEVRCCCQPTKLLGWIDVDASKVIEGRTLVFTPPRYALLHRENVEVLPTAADDRIALPIAMVQFPDGRQYLALKSEETPIERLRTLKAFIEAPPPEPATWPPR